MKLSGKKIFGALVLFIIGALLIQSSEENVTAIDWWSLVHFLAPFMMGFLLAVYVPSKKAQVWLIGGFLVIESAILLGTMGLIGWEILEQTNILDSIGIDAESSLNMWADLIIGIAALFLGYMAGKRKRSED